MNKEIFGGFIADLRRVAGMTQKQVADRLHVTDRAVSKWERGLSYPDVTLMEPLAVVLGVGVEELLTCRRKEAPAPEPELPALRSVLTSRRRKSASVPGGRGYCFAPLPRCWCWQC